jgi:aminopeptidase
MPDPRVTRLARLLVDYSTDIQRDDQVLIWAPASTTGMALMLALYQRVLERGGHPNLAPFLRGPEDIFFRFAQEHQLDYVSPLYKMAVDTFDAVIRVEGVPNTRALSGVDPAKQVRQQQAYAPVQQAYLQRGDAGDLNWSPSSQRTRWRRKPICACTITPISSTAPATCTAMTTRSLTGNRCRRSSSG